jgi:hypothetical protein
MKANRKNLLLGFVGGLVCMPLLLGVVIGFMIAHDPGGELPVTDRVLYAVATYGHQKSGRARNTFYFPTNANLGEEMVVYWKEEHLLFSFPTTVTEEAVRSPTLVVRRVWELNSGSFRLPGDVEAAASTYLESWQQAVRWLKDAIVDGRMVVLENHRPPATIAPNP